MQNEDNVYIQLGRAGAAQNKAAEGIIVPGHIGRLPVKPDPWPSFGEMRTRRSAEFILSGDIAESKQTTIATLINQKDMIMT